MDNIQWLVDHGGPAVKLHLLHASLIDKYAFDREQLVEELLQIEPVRARLGFFDAFKEYTSMSDWDLGGLIHNGYDSSYEQFMPFLIRFGFAAGISALDDKIPYIREVYSYLAKTTHLHTGALIIIQYLLKAGYFYDDMIGYMTEKIINNLHKTAETQAFDIYERDPAQLRQPNRWGGKLIIKDIHNCEIGTLPLPTEYHIRGILHLFKHLRDNETKKKINDILDYVFHPLYQQWHGDYGWHWDEAKKTYHASSRGIDIPLYDSFTLTEPQKWFFLEHLEMMAHAPTVRRSAWTERCLHYLEQYRTEHGTYLFPQDIIYSRLLFKTPMAAVYPAFIARDVLAALKTNQRKPLLFEIYSTLYMAALQKQGE